MKKTERFTHAGWFGICPIYISDLDKDIPGLTPRPQNWFTELLFIVSHYGFMAFFTVADVINPSWNPGFPIVVTEELLVPFDYEYEEDE